MIRRLYFAISLFIWASESASAKPNITFDEFFNYTSFSSLTLAPENGQSILIQTKHRIWDRNISEEHLYLQTLRGENRTLITTQASSFSPRWKGDFIALILSSESTERNRQKKLSNEEQYIHLYAVRTNQMFRLSVGNETVHTFIWSTTSMSIYFATRSSWSTEVQFAYDNDWKDVIEYREQYRGDTIYRADIENMTVVRIEPLANISFRVNEMICSPDGKLLVYSTLPPSMNAEYMADYELYSLDLTRSLPLIPTRLTNNSAIERNLKWSRDGLIFFTVTAAESVKGNYEETQGRLYSLDLSSGRIERWANQFEGAVTEYILLEGGRKGILLLGQLSTEIQIYQQSSISAPLVKLMGWNGTYENIVTAADGSGSTLAFIHSSYERPQEVYFIDDVNQLNLAQQVTNVNQLFSERNLPQGKSYRWTNADDRTEIEGILVYPPDQFEQKNLPLFVLIHGGPSDADVNSFRPNWYYCATMMANEGWLVLQPNYRGSTGYGDEFLRGVRFEILSRPAKDILFGVDALVRDGIADPKRLTLGGYSYGAYLTNWIITETTRFNAALSGAGASEHVADWGLTDIPFSSVYMFGGYPWQVPQLYQQEAPIFQINKARTPTHIVVPANDIRVASSENYILERALNNLQVPTKLIVLPGESHIIGNNPWHEKIKIREEIKWLRKYGHVCISSGLDTSNSASYHGQPLIRVLTFFLFAVFYQI